MATTPSSATISESSCTHQGSNTLTLLVDRSKVNKEDSSSSNATITTESSLHHHQHHRRRTRRVHFGHVEMREYSVTVGALPMPTTTIVKTKLDKNKLTDDTNSFPMSLSWEYISTTQANVDDYECQRKAKRETASGESTDADAEAEAAPILRRLSAMERRERISITQGISLDEVNFLEIERISHHLSEVTKLTTMMTTTTKFRQVRQSACSA